MRATCVFGFGGGAARRAFEWRVDGFGGAFFTGGAACRAVDFLGAPFESALVAVGFGFGFELVDVVLLELVVVVRVGADVGATRVAVVRVGDGAELVDVAGGRVTGRGAPRGPVEMTWPPGAVVVSVTVPELSADEPAPTPPEPVPGADLP